ncbi:uncharacterized protein [Macrobrachium rosenbergii]|uniref:uncharacterized protein isoform X1 n=2 Tax=Macrobrachium rosenbergii TaxID=79674 RepID=UPI0034D76DCD
MKRMFLGNMAGNARGNACWTAVLVFFATAHRLPCAWSQQEDIPILPEFEVSTMAGSTPGEIWVSKNSSYCNWKPSLGPICNYTETSQVVVVPAGLTLPSGQLEVEIHKAKTLHVYPTCISWIQVFDAGLVTTLPSEEDYYTIYRKRCRTWLRIYNSQADSISHGVKDLTIINTQVNTINLAFQRDFMAINSTIKSIEALSWEGYRGTIQNTTVERISHVEAKDNWLVISSHLGLVTPDGIVFKAKEMAVSNSTISHIATNGLKIANGAASLNNVTIGLLEASAIVVSSPSAFLSLSNVTVVSAFANCIILPDRERISIKNVTVNGAPLDLSSSYLKFVDDFVVPKNISKVQVDQEREGCSSNHTTLLCDFSSVNESIELNAHNIEGYHLVQIKNVKSLQVLSTSCELELRLQSVNGTLPHFATEGNHTDESTSSSGGEPLEEDCNMSLSVLDSRLEVISSRYISNVTVANSTVKRLHDGTLQAFNVHNVTVVTMDSVNIAGTGSQWTGMVVGSIINVTLQAPVTAEGILVTQRLRRGALTIDHADATTELSKVKFSTMERESVVVKRGKLILKDLVAIAINEGAIFIEEGASVELYNMVSFVSSYRTISVATRDQVFINGSENMASGLMIHVRNPPPLPDMTSNLTISAIHLSPYCTTVPLFIKVCDFSHVNDASVVVDLVGAQQSHRAVVRGASFVTLYPSCIEKLILMKVVTATTVDNENDCETWLEAKEVHFQNITAGVHDVTLTSCSVDFLAPNRKLRDLDLENTRVEWIAGVHWYGYTGLFNNSHLVKVEGLVASSRMVMSNTTVEKILPLGISVKTEGVIAGCTIDDISTAGITVEGMLRMKDVSIGTLAKRAIVVKDGVLFLSNVRIDSSEALSIIATSNGAVAMQNVTVAGKQVHWRGYITNSLGPDDPSLVFLNKHVSDEVPTIPVLTQEEISKSTPQSSSMTKSLLPDDNESLTSETSKINSKQIDTSSDSWKWAGISVGIFMVILLGCCVVLTVKLVKPNNGKALPIVFWRVKDDQNDLLAEDQGSGDYSEPSTRHSGYHTVPGSEVI